MTQKETINKIKEILFKEFGVEGYKRHRVATRIAALMEEKVTVTEDTLRIYL